MAAVQAIAVRVRPITLPAMEEQSQACMIERTNQLPATVHSITICKPFFEIDARPSAVQRAAQATMCDGAKQSNGNQQRAAHNNSSCSRWNVMCMRSIHVCDVCVRVCVTIDRCVRVVSSAREHASCLSGVCVRERQCSSIHALLTVNKCMHHNPV